MYYAINFTSNITYQQKQGKKFDYIFGDLTDTPVSTQPRDEDTWIFLSTILELAVGGIAFGFQYLFSESLPIIFANFAVLTPKTGKYFTHCIGINAPTGIEAYEKVLSKIGNGKCKFTKTTNFVKSFVETWVFYQITKPE